MRVGPARPSDGVGAGPFLMPAMRWERMTFEAMTTLMLTSNAARYFTF